jgi:hypothetical protein
LLIQHRQSRPRISRTHFPIIHMRIVCQHGNGLQRRRQVGQVRERERREVQVDEGRRQKTREFVAGRGEIPSVPRESRAEGNHNKPL